MTASFTEDLKEGYAGELSEGEKKVCIAFRELLASALRGQIAFRDATQGLWRDLAVLQRFRFDADKAMASSQGRLMQSQPAVLRNVAGTRRKGAPLSKAERAFLEDVDGLIDWATRNGVRLQLVLEILGHDIFELGQHDFDLRKTLHEIMPKVKGWAKLNATPVGEADEQA